MKKLLRYAGIALLGFFAPIIIIFSIIYYYHIGMADIVASTEKIISSFIHSWNLTDDSDNSNTTTRTKNMARQKQSKKMVHLYFADETDQYLKVEDRVLGHPDSPCQFAQILLNALFEGSNKSLNPVLPKGDFLRAVYIENDSHTAYVDLKQMIVAHFPGGVTQELLTIYAIVNTLTLNMREVKQVKIIIGGQEADTLNGHLDIRYPYTTNMLIVR
jgi:spore germination protein GerM